MRRLRGLAIACVVLGLLGGLAVGVTMRVVEDDPARWHVDPASHQRTGKPNDVLVAPAGMTSATSDFAARTHPVSPRDLLFLFDAVAMNSSNVSVLAGSLDDLMITYVQRSTVFGFPDYISVKAVAAGDEAGLIIWSRSRFGHSDLGANRARIERWLQQIGGG